MPHYADGTEVKVGDTATLADGVPESTYVGDLRKGEGLVVRTVTPGADMCNVSGAVLRSCTPETAWGGIVLERALDGRPAVLGVISSLTLTAKGLRLVRRAS